MIKYTAGKKISTFLLLATCLIICASFTIEVKTYSDTAVSVSIKQQNTDVNVLVKAPKNTIVQFYMFNSDGGLVKQIEIKGSGKFSIGNLSKGIYLYELFNKDKKLKHGDIQIK